MSVGRSSTMFLLKNHHSGLVTMLHCFNSTCLREDGIYGLKPFEPPFFFRIKAPESGSEATIKLVMATRISLFVNQTEVLRACKTTRLTARVVDNLIGWSGAKWVVTHQS